MGKFNGNKHQNNPKAVKPQRKDKDTNPNTGKRILGKVKWFDLKRGYGFIEGEDGRDYFVHYHCLTRPRIYKGADPNDDVIFTVDEQYNGKHQVAVDVKVVTDRSIGELPAYEESDDDRAAIEQRKKGTRTDQADETGAIQDSQGELPEEDAPVEVSEENIDFENET